MDASLPVAAPPPFKSRRGWLITFGIVEILIACTFLLMLGFALYMFLGPAARMMPSVPMPRSVLIIFVVLQYGLAAAVFLTGGIGSIRCKNWARIFMLVVSGAWLLLGVVTTLMLAFLVPAMMQDQPGNVPPGVLHIVVTVMFSLLTVLMVLLPAIFLVFYSRPSVRATCLALNEAQGVSLLADGTPATRLPVPLAILGGWQALSALSVFTVLFMRVTVVIGFVLHGAAASLVFLAHGVLSGYSAWAVFRQKLIGWQIALFLTSFWIISGLVSRIRHPNLLQLYREMGYSDQVLGFYSQAPKFMWGIVIGMIVVPIALLVFIVYTRKFFPKEGRA